MHFDILNASYTAFSRVSIDKHFHVKFNEVSHVIEISSFQYLSIISIYKKEKGIFPISKKKLILFII